MGNSQLCVAVTGRTMSEIRRNRDAADRRRHRRDAPRHGRSSGRGRRARGPALSRHRHLPGRLGERVLPGVRGGAAADSRTGDRAGRRVRRRRGEGGVRRRADRRAPGPRRDRVVPCLRGVPGGSRPSRGRRSPDRAPRSPSSPWRRGRSPTPRRSWRSASPRTQRRGGGSPGHVLIAMGDHGLASRVLSTRIGNRVDLRRRQRRARPGIGAAHARRVPVSRPATRDRGLRRRRAIPVMHSLSPVMHNAGFRHFGIDAVYLPLLAKDAADFVAFARALGLAGASITAPFKVHLMESVDELEPLAQRVGAINTLTVRDGRWLGANTDVYGFAAPLIARLRDLPAKAGRDKLRSDDPRRRRRCSSRRRRPGRPRRRGDRLRAAARGGARSGRARRWRASANCRRRPAAGTCSSTPPPGTATRPATARLRRPRSTAASSTTCSTCPP